MWGYGPGMMGYGMGGGMVFGGILWIVFLAFVVYAGVQMFRGEDRGTFGPSRRSTALDMLEERYARGEIGRDEFLEKKADISAAGHERKK